MNRHWTDRKLGSLAAMAAILLLTLDPLMGGDPKPAADQARKKELIRLQMINDMLYASDDFFGETRHLLYADQPLPPAPPPVAVKAAPAGSKSTASNQTGDDETNGGDIPIPDIGGGGGDPGDGGCLT